MDLLQRSTKKVKEPSYMEKLLVLFGGDGNVDTGQKFDHMEDSMMEVKVVVGDGGKRPHVKGAVIPVTDEELQLRLNPWRNTLVVNVLGKRVNFRIIENKLQREWTKNGGIQIIDMHDGYFQVVFKSEEDYKHALFKGPWKVAVIT